MITEEYLSHERANRFAQCSIHLAAGLTAPPSRLLSMGRASGAALLLLPLIALHCEAIPRACSDNNSLRLPFCNTSLSRERRVDDLISRLRLDEKVSGIPVRCLSGGGGAPSRQYIADGRGRADSYVILQTS
jgi:hypothetical protein